VFWGMAKDPSGKGTHVDGLPVSSLRGAPLSFCLRVWKCAGADFVPLRRRIEPVSPEF